MFLCSTGWCRVPGTVATHNVAADQVAQFIVDSQLLDLPPDLLLMLSLSLTKYACSMMANDIHFSWRSPSTLSLKEVREKNKFRCILWVPLSSCYFHTCHSLSMLLSTSNFPLQMLLWLTYSEFRHSTIYKYNIFNLDLVLEYKWNRLFHWL